MKTYLFPAALRKGQPVNTFVVAELGGYWLGTYHDLIDGTHASVATQRISKDLYDAFRDEARQNRKRYKTRTVA